MTGTRSEPVAGVPASFNTVVPVPPSPITTVPCTHTVRIHAHRRRRRRRRQPTPHRPVGYRSRARDGSSSGNIVVDGRSFLCAFPPVRRSFVRPSSSNVIVFFFRSFALPDTSAIRGAWCVCVLCVRV